MTAMLEFDHVTKEYGRVFSRCRIRALDGFSLEVEQGEIFGFLGPNGAGKTTAIHLALGFMRATSGRGRLLGRPFGDAATRARVGFLAENVALYHRRASSLVRFYGALNRMHDPSLAQRTRDVLDLVDMREHAGRNVGRFSRGMMQRIGLAQAMVNDPELLILDEPTSALDPIGRVAVRELLLRAREQGKTIFLSSHMLSEVEQICDRVAILMHGRVVRLGRMPELLQQSESWTVTARGLDPAGYPDATLDGELLSFVASGRVQRQIIERIWMAGGEVVSVTPMRRSLEDLFMQLAAEADEAGSPAARVNA